LAFICRKSFPWYLRWQSDPALVRKWWRVVLATSAAETCVFETTGVVRAFCVLIVDRRKWHHDEELRRTPRPLFLLSLVRKPAAVIFEIWKLLAARWEILRSEPIARVYKFPESATWIEWIAVEPSARGGGVAVRLMAWCEARTRELGAPAIGLTVNAESVPAIRLYEKTGYIRVEAIGSDLIFAKILSAAAAPPLPDKDRL
jgi:GNAT superfamily N-acetyltransferase